MVAGERDVRDGMLPAFLDLKCKSSLAILRLRIHIDLGIEITFLLEVVEDISPAFFDQVGVDGSFFIYWNQLFLLAS